MMLYKYVSFAAAKAILQKNAIGFSQPKFFNDPFDLPSYPPEPTANPIDAQFAHIRTWGKNQIWAENTGILSLTRTPTNPLMWAHYADKHEGIVVGIDAVIAGLTDEDSNFIPAQYGSVIYVSVRTQHLPKLRRDKSSFPGESYAVPIMCVAIILNSILELAGFILSDREWSALADIIPSIREPLKLRLALRRSQLPALSPPRSR
jgi:hypothetical protein